MHISALSPRVPQSDRFVRKSTTFASSFPVTSRRAIMLTAVFALTSKIRGRRGAESTPKMSAQDTTSPSSNDTAIMDCIWASPLATSCGLTPAAVATKLQRWKDLGQKMAKNLGLPLEFNQLNQAQRERIYQYYLPIYFWILQELKKHRAESDGERKTATDSMPLIIGISAPQGCGKSTLCEQLLALLQDDGLTPASISIDDFYLTRKDQESLARKYAGNRLLQTRGNAMTHDLKLGTQTLRALRNAKAHSPPVPLPRYNKSAFQGKGDRADPSAWPTVQGPVDVVLFEGWMLGFSPVSSAAAAAADPDLVPVNQSLADYKKAWDDFVSSWLVVRVADPSFAHKWRLQAEHAMRAAGRDAMTDEEVGAFVDRFMPAYKCYLSGLYRNGPTTARTGSLLVVEVDESRSPIAKQPRPIM